MAMTRKQQRGALILAGLGALGLAAGLILYVLSDTITFFYTPSDVVEKGVKPGTRFRLGGLVEDGSIVRGQGKTVSFKVTDTAGTLPVTYVGILPDPAGPFRGTILNFNYLVQNRSEFHVKSLQFAFFVFFPGIGQFTQRFFKITEQGLKFGVGRSTTPAVGKSKKFLIENAADRQGRPRID